VRFGGLRGNILDRALTGELTEVFQQARQEARLKVICLEGSGEDFSYGASVAQHLPDQAHAMLAAFHGMLSALLDSRVFTIAAVRGHCLGGGLELALLCHRVVAAPTASFAQPEIALGVLAPIASLVLADRIGRGRAEDLCLTGRRIDADEAVRIGLADAMADDPAEAAFAYASTHLLGRSASSLRLAVEAIRAPLRARIDAALPQVERLYLDRLMATHDAVEGLDAFMLKRPPVWRDQ
jgi:cyclohexa-1,5-dienecarbonyl-CoA hydratase